MRLDASFLEDLLPGCDFWEVEKTIAVKVKVIAEAETPEEEPSVSFARAVLDKTLKGVVEFPDEINLWIEDYFKRRPDARDILKDMCNELVFKTGGQIAIKGAIKGSMEGESRVKNIGKLLNELGLDVEDEY